MTNDQVSTHNLKLRLLPYSDAKLVKFDQCSDLYLHVKLYNYPMTNDQASAHNLKQDHLIVTKRFRDRVGEGIS